MELTTANVSDALRRYSQAGLCVLPAIPAEKRPAVGRWKAYQTRMPTTAELSAWSANNPDAVCILCGQASGNAETIDFDAGGELFDAWCRAVPADLLARLVISSTPSGGWHVCYRFRGEVCGNLKLAQRQTGKTIVTLIETRGEGGLVLCSPSPGYEIAQGDLCDLPVLSAEQRDTLLRAAWDLNEYWPPLAHRSALSADNSHSAALSASSVHNPECAEHSSHNGQSCEHNSHSGQLCEDSPHIPDCAADNPHNADGGLHNSHSRQSCEDSPHNPDCATDNPHNADGGLHNSHSGQWPADNPHNGPLSANNADRPGDDFNNRGDVRAVLHNAGWVRVKGGQNEYWRRPGKESGTSATLKDRVFYVFSSNAAPFEPNTAYSPFSVYTMLNCAGDFAQAARSLRTMGYGGDYAADNSTGADLSAIVGSPGDCAAVNGGAKPWRVWGGGIL